MKVARLMVSCVVAGLVAAVAFAGPASAATVSPQEWAPKFCTAFIDWQSQVKSDGDAAQEALSGNATNLELAKSQLTAFLAKSVKNTNAAAKSLRAAGSPDVSNGAAIEAKLVKVLEDVSKVFRSAGKTAASAPTNNAKKFLAVASKITKALNQGGTKVSSGIGSIGSLDKDKTLSTVLSAEPACASFTGSGSSS